MANGHDESNASVSPCADESSLSFKVDSKIVALVKNLADQLKDANFTPLNPDYLSSGFDELQIKYKQLDSILNETVSKTRSSSSDFGEDCLELISAGQGQENFFKAVLNCDTALTCGIILGIDQLWCYRCKTCALTQYMCLCVACFKGGNHQGHDFYASKLGNRGTCDCGNSSVIKPSGFCWQHRIKPSGQLAIPPKYIMSVAEFLVPKMFHRLLEDFVLLTDYNSNEEFSSIKSSISALTELSELGALSHALLTKILISPTIYKSFKRNSKAEEEEMACNTQRKAIATDAPPRRRIVEKEEPNISAEVVKVLIAENAALKKERERLRAAAHRWEQKHSSVYDKMDKLRARLHNIRRAHIEGEEDLLDELIENLSLYAFCKTNSS